MPDLTPEQIAQGIFLDTAGNPTNPDGTPVESRGGGPAPPNQGILDVMGNVVNGWKPNQYEAPDPNVAQQYAQQANTGGLFTDAMGNLTDSSGVALSQYVQRSMEAQTPANADPVSYGIGPSYGASANKYYGPVLDPGIWLGEPESTDTSQMLDYSGGGPYPTNWEDYKSNNRTSGGGFFTLNELAEVTGRPNLYWRGGDLPSTNNYRLIPGGRQGFIMRNGVIIDPHSNSMYGPFGMAGMNDSAPAWRSGLSEGVPSAYAPGSTGWNVVGWPGAISSGGFFSTSTSGT